jgi:hypothetical protein
MSMTIAIKQYLPVHQSVSSQPASQPASYDYDIQNIVR